MACTQRLCIEVCRMHVHRCLACTSTDRGYCWDSSRGALRNAFKMPRSKCLQMSWSMELQLDCKEFQIASVMSVGENWTWAWLQPCLCAYHCHGPVHWCLPYEWTNSSALLTLTPVEAPGGLCCQLNINIIKYGGVSKQSKMHSYPLARYPYASSPPHTQMLRIAQGLPPDASDECSSAGRASNTIADNLTHFSCCSLSAAKFQGLYDVQIWL